MAIEKDTVVKVDGDSYAVQADPPLVIHTMSSGEEVHHAGDDAHSIWDRLQEYLADEGLLERKLPDATD